MSDLRRVREEFGRQAAALEEAPAFRSDAILGRIRAALGPAPLGRVLDVACGPGLVLEALAPGAAALAGVDATPRMLARARRRLAAAGAPATQLHVARAEALPFADGAFDAVVTRLALHHMAAPAAALREMRRVLRPGGRLVVADLLGAEPPEAAALHDAIERLRDPTHVRALPREELLAALRAAGLDVTETEELRQARRFDEWAAVVAVPERTEPLRPLLAALARRGEAAGIALREEEGEIAFTHRWLVVTARPA